MYTTSNLDITVIGQQGLSVNTSAFTTPQLSRRSSEASIISTQSFVEPFHVLESILTYTANQYGVEQDTQEAEFE